MSDFLICIPMGPRRVEKIHGDVFHYGEKLAAQTGVLKPVCLRSGLCAAHLLLSDGFVQERNRSSVPWRRYQKM